jgi:hypothetical protein
MRSLSNTENGGRVVEFTRDEWRQFKILALSLEGKTMDEAQTEFMYGTSNNDRASAICIIEYDFNGVFGAIRAFYEANFQLSELKQLVGKFDKFMEIKKDILDK